MRGAIVLIVAFLLGAFASLSACSSEGVEDPDIGHAGRQVSEALSAGTPGAQVNWVPPTTYRPKQCQLTGDFDQETTAPTSSLTETRASVRGTDLGFSFLHNDTLYFLFGDTYSRNPSIPPNSNWDFLANRPADAGLCDALNIPTDSSSQFHAAKLGSGTTGTFQVPFSGFSDGTNMFAFFSLAFPFATSTPGSAPHTGASVLSIGTNTIGDFARVGTFDPFLSIDRFRFVDPQVVQAGVPGLPPPLNSQAVVLLFGSGEYRHSYPYLAVAPLAGFSTSKSNLQFFKGLSNGLPTWGSNESDAAPLFWDPVDTDPNNALAVEETGDNKCVGELSVAYQSSLMKWIMLYDCVSQNGVHGHFANDSGHYAPLSANNKRGITMRASDTPWGPWSDPTVIFDPTRPGDGYGHFMQPGANGWTSTNRGDLYDYEAPSPQQSQVTYYDENISGGEYAPFLMPSYFTGNPGGGLGTIYYTMSTWNPYQVMIMRADLALGTTLQPILDAGPPPAVPIDDKIDWLAANASLPPGSPGKPALATDPYGKVEAFVRDGNGEIRHAWSNADLDPMSPYDAWLDTGLNAGGLDPILMRNSLQFVKQARSTLEAFATAGGHLKHFYQTAVDSPNWVGWSDVPGTPTNIFTPPSAILAHTNTICASGPLMGRVDYCNAEVGVVVGTPAVYPAIPAAMHWLEQTPDWGWTSVALPANPAPACGYPVAAVNADGRPEVYVNCSGTIWHTWWYGSAFISSWAALPAAGCGPGTFAGTPVATNELNGAISIYSRTTCPQEIEQIWQGTSTAPVAGSNFPPSWWRSPALNVVITGDPAVGMNQDGRLEVFVRGSDGQVWHIWQPSANGPGFVSAWGGFPDDNRPGSIAPSFTNGLAVISEMPAYKGYSDPTSTSRLDLFGAATDGQIYHTWQILQNAWWR